MQVCVLSPDTTVELLGAMTSSGALGTPELARLTAYFPEVLSSMPGPSPFQNLFQKPDPHHSRDEGLSDGDKYAAPSSSSKLEGLGQLLMVNIS